MLTLYSDGSILWPDGTISKAPNISADQVGKSLKLINSRLYTESTQTEIPIEIKDKTLTDIMEELALEWEKSSR